MKAVSSLRRANDPFAAALMPPPEETEDERVKRVCEQEEAARISQKIDEGLQEAKKQIEKRKKATKVLLLGKLTPLHTPRPFISPQVSPSPARVRPSRVSAPPLCACSSPSHDCRSTRLPALLLSFSVQKGEGGLEIGHTAQPHQVIILRLSTLSAPFSHYS